MKYLIIPIVLALVIGTIGIANTKGEPKSGKEVKVSYERPITIDGKELTEEQFTAKKTELIKTVCDCKEGKITTNDFIETNLPELIEVLNIELENKGGNLGKINSFDDIIKALQ